MIRKIAIMAGMAATLASAGVAHAGYYETFNGVEGDFSISDFSPTGANGFKVKLNNLEGSASLQIPAPGTYGVTLNPGFSLNLNGAPPVALPVATPLGSVTINSIGLPAGIPAGIPWNFNFTGSDSLNTVSFASIPNAHVDISGSGVSSFLAGLLGLPVPLTASGTLGVDIDFDDTNNGMVVVIDDSLFSVDLDALLYRLDAKLGGNDGIIDGTFEVNGSVHVPEPGSLALLGLGLAGLATARRRAANQTA